MSVRQVRKISDKDLCAASKITYALVAKRFGVSINSVFLWSKRLWSRGALKVRPAIKIDRKARRIKAAGHTLEYLHPCGIDELFKEYITYS